MKYLSFDIEATGLEENAHIIEFGMVPFDTETGTIDHSLAKHFFIKCPSYEELEPNLNEWVKKHNKELIQTAHSTGISISWGEWFGTLAAIMIPLFLLVPYITYIVYPPAQKSSPEAPAWAAKELKSMGPSQEKKF